CRSTSQSRARRMRVAPYTSSVTKSRSRCSRSARSRMGGSARLAYAPWSIRRNARTATRRGLSVIRGLRPRAPSAAGSLALASSAKRFAGGDVRAVSPCRRGLWTLALGLHLDQLDAAAITRADDETVDHAGLRPNAHAARAPDPE